MNIEKYKCSACENHVHKGQFPGIMWYEEYLRDNYNVTHKRHYYVRHNGNISIFSTSYFNNDDIEVAYIIHDLITLCGVTILDKPRLWSNEFKLDEYYSRPIIILGYEITNKGYIGENK